MIELHYSNRIENLVDPLADRVAAGQEKNPIAPVSIVVPNRTVEQFVKYRLAEHLGVAANLKFPFLRVFLADLVQRADPKIRVLEADGLRSLLFERLDPHSRAAGNSLESVDAYLGAQGSADASRDLPLYRLADRLAALFHGYSITRGGMIAGWPRSSRLKNQPWAATERWQRELWGLVFEKHDERSVVRAELIRDPALRWMLLPDAMSAIPDDALKPALPDEIHIFALPNAGPAYVRIFSKLAALTSLHVYAVNPCLEFWEDLITAGGADRARMIHLVHRGAKVGEPFGDDADRFGLLEEGENRALRLWGRPGREYIRLLNELTECDFDDRFSRPADGDHTTLLATLQDDILMRTAAADAKPPPGGRRFANDVSIRILACPGLKREAEIVAGAIWSVLRADSGPRPIRFNEIAVLVPDASCDRYLPHLESVFGREPRIPFEVAGRRSAGPSRAVEAVELLLELPLGRFTREQVVHLLTHPATLADQQEMEPERWGAWCAEAGVIFGADRETLRGTYLDGDLYHWDQALRRMALGVFMTGERGGEPTFARADGADYLPLELGQDATAGVMRLVRTARTMIADALAIAGARMTLPQWSRAIAEYVARYVREGDPDSSRARERCLRALAEMAPDDFKSRAVGYEVAREAALRALSAAQSGLGRLRGHGVAVGSMDTLRSIPFRVIFAIGLGEADFPARERNDPLDLTRGARSAGDVSPSERDRYLFLDAILAARERLFLSYVNRNPQTGEALEPSAVVRELEYLLRAYLDDKSLDNLTIVHPVSRYDLKYFRSLPGAPTEDIHPELSSFDASALRGARMASLRSCAQKHADELPLPGRDEPLIHFMPEALRPALREQLTLPVLANAEPPSDAAPAETSIPLAALRRYLECPLQGAARYALGMNEEDDDDQEYAADEPLERTRLDRTIALREVFELAASVDDTNRRRIWNEHFRIAAMHGRAPAGAFKDAAQRSDFEMLGAWWRQARQAGAGALDNFIQIRMGAADEFAPSQVRIDPLPLEVKITGPENRVVAHRVRLHGGLGLARKSSVDAPYDAALLAIARPRAAAADFMRLALGIYALAAASEPLAPRFSAIIVTSAQSESSAAEVRMIPAPSRDEACDYLKDLVSDLLSTGNDTFLPIEAVETVRELGLDRDSRGGLAAVVEALRENGNHPVRSDHGPVREARARFQAPDQDEIARIISRRYDPIRWIFSEPRAARGRRDGA